LTKYTQVLRHRLRRATEGLVQLGRPLVASPEQFNGLTADRMRNGAKDVFSAEWPAHDFQF
jgi:hypothetical protein